MKLTNSTPNIPRPSRSHVAGNDWTQVQAGFVTGYARKRDGSLWAWGLNNFGQLELVRGLIARNPFGRHGNELGENPCGRSKRRGYPIGRQSVDLGRQSKLGNNTPQSPLNLLVPTRFASDTNWVDVAVAFNLWMYRARPEAPSHSSLEMRL